MRTALAFFVLIFASIATVVAACDNGTATPGGQHVHIGCQDDAGIGCAEDLTITGVCAQDRPHLCFCGVDGSAKTPNGDCLSNNVKPYDPYTHALCCP